MRSTSSRFSSGQPPPAVFGAVVLVASLWASSVVAQTVELQLGAREVHAGVPVILSALARGFEAEPAPTISDLSIPGCDVTYEGLSPQVSPLVTFVNGRQVTSRDITYVFQFRVVARAGGSYQVPSLTVSQSGVEVATQRASFTVQAVEATADLAIRLRLPERAVWVGERLEVPIELDLRREADDPNFTVPLFGMSDVLTVEAPDNTGRRGLRFAVGSRSVTLPYTGTTFVDGGIETRRFTITAIITPQRAGRIEIGPTEVYSNLQDGVTYDRFGRQVPTWAMYRATDETRMLEVRSLPQANRPTSFSGSVGRSFSIDVEASQTVVQLGDPIELTLTVRGDTSLEGLQLPALAGAGLLADHFTPADDAPLGELLPDGSGKIFRVTVRVQSTDATEIPALAFSYFNPNNGSYETVHADPIALAVAGGNVVRAEDVVSSVQSGRPDAAIASTSDTRVRTTGTQLASLIGADLSISEESATMESVPRPRDAWPLIAALYLLPAFMLMGRVWQVRTQKNRGARSGLRQAHSAVSDRLEEARRAPARDSGPRLVAALQALSRAAGARLSEASSAIEQLETEAFNPAAASEPLSRSVRDDVRAVADRWLSADADGQAGVKRARSGLVLLVVCALLPIAHLAWAQDSDASLLVTARQGYREALEANDRSTQIQSFSAAEAAFGELVSRNPDSPELLTDWGNAALGARDLGTAVVAYRRALFFDSRNARARQNLEWLRDQQPDWVPTPETDGALETLYFWRRLLTPTQRHLLGALCFGLGLLLLAPWGRRARSLRYLAILPFLVWTTNTAALMFEPGVAQDAVVVANEMSLRSADSVGAPVTFPNPLPAGTEVEITEERPGWSRLSLANGATGWLPSDALVWVVPRGE